MEKILEGVVFVPLFSCRPPAILRRVIPVIVDAVNLMAFRLLPPHVLSKRLKAVQPPLAHLDAPASVVLVRRVIRVVATGLDRHVG